MKRTERIKNHGLFMLLFFVLVMLLPIRALAQANIIYYPINVGGVPVTSENYMGITGDNIEGLVSYDDQSATLTLEGATISSGGIEYLASGELTLVITGNCNIRGNILSTGSSTLTMQLNDMEDPGSLIYKPSNGDASGFTKIVYNGMYLSEENARDVKYSPTRQRFESSPYASTSEVKFSSDKTYELWLGSTKVTEANKNNILGGETVTATFNPNDSTLTLNGMKLVGTSISNSGIISRLEKLTIIIVGSNTITAFGDSTAIRADMEGEQKLIIAKGGDDCSLVLNASHAIHDFSTLTLNGLFWNDRFTYKFDETLSGYPSGYRLMLSDGVEAKKDDDTGFKPTLSDTEEYGIIVTTDVTGPISVTNKNRMNVLNDVATAPTVQFDGVNKLILNNAHLQKIDMKVRPTFEKSGLTIFLKGTNVIDNDDDAAISYADYTPISMTFSTTEVNGGQLTCSYDDFSYPFPNLEAKYKNFLLLSSDDANRKLIISQQIPTLVNEETKKVVLDGGGTGLGKDIKDKTTEELAAGVIVNKVLYLLGEDDGCAEDEDIVCLNSTDYDNDVYRINQEVIAGRITPGTSEFVNKSGFKGLIFLLPAGSGKFIIEYNTSTEGSLGVQIGKELHGLDEVSEMTTEEIPYILTVPSYVYIFSLDTDASRKYNALRAPGKKQSNTAQIRRIEVKADKIGCAPMPSLSPKRLTKADVNALIEAKGGLKYGDELTITDGDYTSIDDDALESFKTNNLKVTYLDLSQTSITGLVVDRKLPPFDRLIDGAFVYLPYGNDLVKYDNYVNINNVVIGDVCPYVLLPDNDNPFKLAKNFKAGYIEMERSFWQEYCTICLPFDATRTILANHTFYQIKSVVGNTITMEVVEQPKANVPYMLYPESEYMSDASNIVEFKKEIPEPIAVNGLTFVGTYETKKIVSSATEDVFCFIDEGNFVRVKTNPITINPFRGYMTMPASSGSQFFNIVWGDGTTGLNDGKSKMSEVRGDVFFDLQGRQVTNPTKGIYIHNGKKIVFNR